MDTNNVIIIGGGPAGVSAALYTVRAGVKTLLIASAGGALAKAKEIENYYGFTNPISGQVLLQDGLNQARRLGAEILADKEVVAITEDDKGFIVETSDKASFPCKVLILATGASRAKPKWQGFNSYEGRGVSYCAVCDAFFSRGKDVAVAGSGAYALHEAQALLPLVRSVTLCTDGQPLSANFPPDIKIMDKPVESLIGEAGLSGLTFKDGSSIEINALFVAIGTAGSTGLASSMGVALKDGDVIVDKNMRTNVPCLLAAGDNTGGMKQIAKAVYEGAVAGTEAVKIIREGLVK